MKTVITTFLFAVCTTFVLAQAPDWNTNGNGINSSNWFGTNNNFAIDFRTNNINRMRLMENGSTTINTGLQTVNYNGFLGLSADPTYWSQTLSLSNII